MSRRGGVHFREGMFEDLDPGGGELEGDPLGDVVVPVNVKEEVMEGVLSTPSVTNTADNMELGSDAGDRGHDRMSTRGKGSNKINLLAHCVFCLRETRNQKNKLSREKMKAGHFEDIEVVPRAQKLNSTVLSTLNQVWPWLQHQKNGGVGGDSLRFLGMPAVFTGLPEMCHFCADKMESVHKQFLELMKELTQLGKVIRESKYGGKYSWRAEQFEQVLRDSNLEEDSIQATIKCLGNLGKEDEGVISSNVNEELRTVDTGPCTPDELLEDPIFDEEFDAAEDSRISVEENDFNVQPDCIIKSEPDEEEEREEACEEEGDEWQPSQFSDFEEDHDNQQVDNPASSTRSKRSLRPRKSKTVTRTASGSDEDIDDDMKACDLCDYQTRSRKNLWSHKKRVHKNGGRPQGHKCDLCKDIVPSRYMHAHVQDHIGEEYCIKCPNPSCPLVYSQPSSMSLHLVCTKKCREQLSPEELQRLPTKRGRHKYVCDICGHVAQNCVVMASHLTQTHETDAKPLTCPISGCERRFSLKQSVVLHLPHHDFSQHVTTQRCDLCNRTLHCDNMEQHLKVDHGTNQIIKCKQCALLFSSREALLDHLLAHRYNGMTCDICDDNSNGVTFSEHTRLREHYFNQHQIGKRYDCDECSNFYWRNKELSYHKKNIHGGNRSGSKKDNLEAVNSDPSSSGSQGDKIFKCEFCDDVVYKSLRSLRDHNINFHGADKYKCQFCSEECSTYQQLKIHERGHKGKGLSPGFLCEVEGCGKTFKQKKGLQRHHSVTHLGLRAHVCETCGKSYADEGGLKKHKNSVHLGLRPYVCSECGDSFFRESYLKNHMLIHTGERPYACDICGQRFRQREALKPHMARHQSPDFKAKGPLKHTKKKKRL